jgi:predicted MFS family arabinose efflux permease
VALITRLASLDPPNAPLLVSLNSSALYLGVAAAGGTGSLAITLFGDRWFLLVGAGLMTVATAVATFTTRTPRAASGGEHEGPPRLKRADPVA